MSEESNVPQKVQRMKKVIKKDSVQEQFDNALEDNSNQFVANLIELYSNDTYLQNCKPQDVIKKALQAATLNLPLNKQLGYAHIVPFKSRGEYKPTFIIGYKGYIQLAQRTGKYKFLNADKVYEGEEVVQDKLTGHIEIKGEPEGPDAEVKGYFAYMELHNGFSKGLYMTEEEIREHAREYSPSYNNDYSAWQTNFDSMALKTPIRLLMKRWGPMSTEMITAVQSDESQETTESRMEREKAAEANQEVVDIEEEDPEMEEEAEEGESVQQDEEESNPDSSEEESKGDTEKKKEKLIPDDETPLEKQKSGEEGGPDYS